MFVTHLVSGILRSEVSHPRVGTDTIMAQTHPEAIVAFCHTSITHTLIQAIQVNRLPIRTTRHGDNGFTARRWRVRHVSTTVVTTTVVTAAVIGFLLFNADIPVRATITKMRTQYLIVWFRRILATLVIAQIINARCSVRFVFHDVVEVIRLT